MCATPSTRRSFRLSTRRAGVNHRYQSSINSIMHNVLPTVLLNVQKIVSQKKTVHKSSAYAINGFSLLQILLGSYCPLLQIVW